MLTREDWILLKNLQTIVNLTTKNNKGVQALITLGRNINQELFTKLQEDENFFDSLSKVTPELETIQKNSLLALLEKEVSNFFRVEALNTLLKTPEDQNIDNTYNTPYLRFKLYTSLLEITISKFLPFNIVTTPTGIQDEVIIGIDLCNMAYWFNVKKLYRNNLDEMGEKGTSFFLKRVDKSHNKPNNNWVTLANKYHLNKSLYTREVLYTFETNQHDWEWEDSDLIKDFLIPILEEKHKDNQEAVRFYKEILLREKNTYLLTPRESVSELILGIKIKTQKSQTNNPLFGEGYGITVSWVDYSETTLPPQPVPQEMVDTYLTNLLKTNITQAKETMVEMAKSQYYLQYNERNRTKADGTLVNKKSVFSKSFHLNRHQEGTPHLSYFKFYLKFIMKEDNTIDIEKTINYQNLHIA